MVAMANRSWIYLFGLAALLLPAAARAADHSVEINDLKYAPKQIKIEVGDSVTWENKDERDHTVKGDDKDFSSGKIAPGKSFTFKFTKTGEYKYACEYHPRMKGTVVVGSKK